MKELRDRGLTLRVYESGETSLLARVFLGNYGIVSVLAKGARKRGNRFKNLLENFASADFFINGARRGDLYYLHEISSMRRRLALAKDYRRMLFADYFCRLVEALNEENTANPNDYQSLEKALDYMRDNPVSTKIAARFELRLAFNHGLLNSQSAKSLVREQNEFALCSRTSELLNSICYNLPRNRAELLGL